MMPLLLDLSNVVFPRSCPLCLKSLYVNNLFLCPECQDKIQLNRPPFCVQCSRPLSKSLSINLCSQCIEKKYFFDRAWGASLYNDTMKHLIHLFKYKYKIYLRHVFKDIMISFAKDVHVSMDTFDALIPVALHPVKLREREYNQSEVLAESLGSTFNRPVLKNCLVRTRPTKSQALLIEKERWTNVQGAFRIKHHSKISGRSLLIVDDLMTTGATASEIAKMLKSAGAKYVGVFTLAIA